MNRDDLFEALAARAMAVVTASAVAASTKLSASASLSTLMDGISQCVAIWDESLRAATGDGRDSLDYPVTEEQLDEMTLSQTVAALSTALDGAYVQIPAELRPKLAERYGILMARLGDAQGEASQIEAAL